MKRNFAIIFWLWFSSAYAEPTVFRSLEPTPLKLQKIGQENVAYFNGKVQLVGNFIAGWENKGGPPYVLIVSFYPSKKSLRLLPFPKGEQPPKVIVFSNEKEAAKLLLTPAKLAALLAEENKYTEQELFDGASFKTYNGFAKVTIDKYTTGVECDFRSYSARLLSVESFNLKLSANSLEQLPC